MADWKEVSSTGGVVDALLGAQTEAQFDAARQAFVSIVDRVTYEDFVKLVSGMSEAGSRRAIEGILEWDASEDAASVVAPTLVLARQDDKMYPVETMQPLAAAIPGARFLIMPGKGSWAFDGDPAPMLKALEDLQTPRPRDHAEPRVQGLRTLLFTDPGILHRPHPIPGRRQSPRDSRRPRRRRPQRPGSQRRRGGEAHGRRHLRRLHVSGQRSRSRTTTPARVGRGRSACPRRVERRGTHRQGRRLLRQRRATRRPRL